LTYNAGLPAPRVAALGRDGEALRILAIAREAGVAIVEDPALVALIEAGAGVGDFIPPWCWEAAAHILAFVRTKEQR
jgi:type III secretion system FlhB-like substrate exporter